MSFTEVALPAEGQKQQPWPCLKAGVTGLFTCPLTMEVGEADGLEGGLLSMVLREAPCRRLRMRDGQLSEVQEASFCLPARLLPPSFAAFF